jgi:hypothetical protein
MANISHPNNALERPLKTPFNQNNVGRLVAAEIVYHAQEKV